VVRLLLPTRALIVSWPACECGTESRANSWSHAVKWILTFARKPTARNGWKIDSTAGREPFAMVMRDGVVIAGLEEGLVGMHVGGRRRCVIPANLGYKSAADRPVPPEFGAYQRFKNIYLNRDRPTQLQHGDVAYLANNSLYIPDLVFDVTLRAISGPE
jgi:FKBP-type peptidyl-prolyl cis-trans isomerase